MTWKSTNQDIGPEPFEDQPDAVPNDWSDKEIATTFKLTDYRDGVPVHTSRHKKPVSKLRVAVWTVEGWKYSVEDAWKCLRGTHYAKEINR